MDGKSIEERFGLLAAIDAGEVVIEFIPPYEGSPWPPHARTLQEAFDIMRPPVRKMTRAELEAEFPKPQDALRK